ncbi:hypothetical protein AJ80_03565 [Polytolypa hystricis UAMH7299]|uniref:DUF7703 domain-containing protein n=1 Tax=Polytolypa hystricis (strain UAMH7299) TaxID=1447883 RepID=A0A2B7YGW6_POLH7|nr:hypothetical protein AJ80_03565 [Polytolypa hystricis UAMH7299]
MAVQPMASTQDDGVTGAYEGDLGAKIAIATFLGIAWYNAIELIVLTFVGFQHYRGLYFWSLLLSAIGGVIPYSIGFLLKFFELMDWIWLPLILLSVGWWVMITGQSFVLYSRLHLVLRDQKILRRVLYMIIIDAVLLHLPTTILTFGSNSSAKDRFVPVYNVMEKIQMTGFCVQEFIISTLYIWETVKMLRISPEKGNRKIMWQLLSINIIFILMDLGLLAAAYANLYAFETTLKGTIYSIKLKLEFAVLGKLIHFVNLHTWNPELSNGPNGFPDFVDASRITSDVTHAPQCSKGPPKPPWSQDDHDNPDSTPMMAMTEQSKTLPSESTGPRSEHGASLSLTGEHQSDPTIPRTPIDVTQTVPRQRPKSSYPEWPS